MQLRRVSILLPCERLDNFPTHLSGDEAAELLAAWTALWHPALIAGTGRLPGWHPAEDPPDPDAFEAELVVVPSVSSKLLAGDWCERLRATAPKNPPPVATFASRNQTLAAVLGAAGLESTVVEPGLAADFLALGFAHLQVELLTRAMRYSTVLDTDQFTSAVLAAAQAALAGELSPAREELGRAFDLLADARNHVYAVDFYVVDVALLAATTLGEPLQTKLAERAPTNVLATGELIEQLAREYPATLAALRAAIEAETACILGGPDRHMHSAGSSPEAVLSSLEKTQQSVKRHLGTECEIFGQYDAAFSPLLPEVLAGLGFRGALHAAFDGGRLPRAEQCKTRWGTADGAWIEALSTVPLDATRPETWLNFAEHAADTIAHDHVATILLAGWPGQECEYFGDLRRASRYAPVLGRLITLGEYFRTTRETDDWTSFMPREYPLQEAVGTANVVSSRVEAYGDDVKDTHRRLAVGLASIAGLKAIPTNVDDDSSATLLNPWSFPTTAFLGADLLRTGAPDAAPSTNGPAFIAAVPGCGYANLRHDSSDRDAKIADGHQLRNELLELTVSATTGGIQSLRMHRDRSTRVSQRLIFQRPRIARETPTLDSQMVAESIEVTHNNAVIGEITARGRLHDAAGQLLAHFTQTVRLGRALPAVVVDVQLEPVQMPEGDIWSTYFASRLAWSDEAVSLRRGLQWTSRETSRERVESPEFVEISNGVGTIVLFGLGLPLHRRASGTWLDTLLCAEGESQRRFQFALGLDCKLPVHTALSLITAGSPYRIRLDSDSAPPSGWFLHVGARNLLSTHIEPLDGGCTGIRCRVLETEGREAETTLADFRPFRIARRTDFRGLYQEVLSIVDGQVRFHIGPHRWIQIEAEW